MKLHRIVAAVGASALLLGSAACGAPSPAPSEQRDEGHSSAADQRSAIQTVAEGKGYLEGLTAAAALPKTFKEGYTDFAVSLIKQAAKKGENTFVSPASVYLALAMTANGAAGDTAAQMLRTLGVADFATLNAGCLDLQSVITGNEKKSFQLANGIWIDKDIASAIQTAFLEANKQYFGARATIDDIDEPLIASINQWVADNTAGRITDLLGKSAAESAAILVNTLLFEGEWDSPFIVENTRQGVFHGAAGDKTLPMMFQRLDQPTWYEDAEVQATRLRLNDGRTSLLLALPKTSGAQALHDWMAALDRAKMERLMTAVGNAGKLDLTIPKFSLPYKADLKELLAAMGMRDAFDVVKANFSAMARPNHGLYIEKVNHQTRLEINEKGMLAAAATAVEMRCGAALTQGGIVKLTLDRPFFCALVDEKTGALLFGGAVNQPESLKEGN